MTHTAFSPNSHLRLLLVEDNDADAELCLLELERAGIPVRARIVQNARELAQCLQPPFAFDVVVSDFALPDWNGLEVLRTLQEQHLDVPFILLTGTIGEERAVESIKAGVADCVLKTSMGRLPLAIRRALRERSLQRERERALQELRWAHDQLEARVEMRTAELQKANRDLRCEMAERQEAQERAARLAAIIEAMQDFVATATLDGEIVYLNSGARRLLQLAANDPAPHALEQLLPTWQTHLSSVPQDKGPEAGWRGEACLLRRDGSSVPVLALLMLHRDSAGEAYVSVVAHDITQRKEVERLKDEWVSTVSHELRTPLASLRGFAELMLEREFERPQRLAYLRIVHDESLRLSQLIDELLDLQKMEAGKLPYQFAELRLDDLLHQCVAVFDSPGSAHHFVLRCDPELSSVIGDAVRLREVFTNLISNAVKYSPGGGQVEVRVARQDEEVVVSVRDEGIGIPDEALPNLFTKFFRAENGANRSIGGTGLGLALVKQIVQAHAGRAWARSAHKQGSCFFVALPVNASEATITSSPTDAEPSTQDVQAS